MQPPVTHAPPSPTPHGPRWLVLRTASILLKIVAVLFLLGSLALALLFIIGITINASYINPLPGVHIPPLVLGLVSLVGIASALALYAFADLILLFVAIEKNTRPRY
ncbi:hypothetical protein [Ktedonobacter racemifer]|uniref:Uncharacterized protein n=1 Tax=Ktedonobacter racemifer DSM 44963 TaxID=485913 RepID=D6THV6_KTERA|nr:hypothetical protein [Ktedonobacter racemifer]EFH90926.1 conserved hypothetical protein [Ktedonobacter racemifer DSM 44963]